MYYTMHLEALPVAARNHHEMYLYDKWIKNNITAPFPVTRSGVLEKLHRGQKGNATEIDQVLSTLSMLQSQGRQTHDLVFRLQNALDHFQTSRAGKQRGPTNAKGK